MYLFRLLLVCFFVKYSESCDCNKKKELERDDLKDVTLKMLKLSAKPAVDKRQLSDPDYDNGEPSPGELSEETSPRIKKQELQETETLLEANDTEFRSNSEEVLPMCPYFKPGEELNFERMVDVWRLAFFRSSAELGCFKILLKNLRPETKEYFAEKFGDFNKTVNWDDCVLQLTNGRVLPAQEQTHFLQKIGNNSGLLSNIIITEENKENMTLITLQDHSPDQWMLVDNLLLMRDCDNGDVVVFSRVPFEPTRSEINIALDRFGETVKEGVWTCRGQNQAALTNPRYQILS